jgi:hypothetical protein
MPAEGKASACDTEDCAKDDESEERDVQTDDGCNARSGDWQDLVVQEFPPFKG